MPNKNSSQKRLFVIRLAATILYQYEISLDGNICIKEIAKQEKPGQRNQAREKVL
jgi:hypothetical protein